MDSSTKTMPGSTVGNSGQATKSKPVCLEVPVTVRSLPGEKGDTTSGQAKPMREEARTVIVFENGAVLRLAGDFPAGQAVILSNSQGRDVVCRVVVARSLPTVKGYIEVEFVEAVSDFWGIHQPAVQPQASTPPTPAVVPPPVAPLPAAPPQIAASVPVAPPPPAVPTPQNIASEPAPAPPAPVRSREVAPEAAAPSGKAPSFEDIPGLDRMSLPAAVRERAIEPAPRGPASKISEPSPRGPSDPAIHHLPVNTPASGPELTSLSASWEGSAGAAWKPSPSSGKALGGTIFASTDGSTNASSSGLQGKTGLIIAGAAAVLLVALGVGRFVLSQGSVPAPAAPQAAANQPSKFALPPATKVPEPAVRAEVPAEPVLPMTSNVTLPSLPSEDKVSAPISPAPQVTRRQEKNTPAKQAVEVKPVDRTVPPRPSIPDLKMSGPTADSRNVGRLVDGSVPNIADDGAASRLIPASSGTLMPSAAPIDNPPAPPVAFPSASASAASNATSSASSSTLSPAVKTSRDPKLISSTRTIYPTTARQASIEGDVVVTAQIDATGKVVSATAESGPVALRQAAVATVLQWKYEPALVNGKPAPGQASIKIQFRLK